MVSPEPLTAERTPVGDLVDELAAVTPVITDPDLLASFARDEADMCDVGSPLVLVRPRTTAEVAAIVKIAAARRIPIVPQGGRTGLAGAANAWTARSWCR